MEEKDIYIKDEGEFASVFFQSERAKEEIKKQPKAVVDQLYEGLGMSSTVVRLDIDLEAMDNIIAWAVSHDLSYESEF